MALPLAAYTAIEASVALVAVLGNFAVLFCFTRERRLRRLTNYYILSLAATDLLVGLFGIPFAILTKAGLPRHAPVSCVAMLSFLIVLCTVSILHLVAVSLDRYWAILHPMTYKRLASTSIVVRVIAACWVLGCVVGFMPLFGWNSVEAAPDGYCLFLPVMRYGFLVFLYFATIVYPALLIAYCYCRIYRVVRKQVRQISSFENAVRNNFADTSGEQHPLKNNSLTPMHVSSVFRPNSARSVVPMVSRREVRTAKILFSIVIFFMLCWFPLYTLNCVKAFCNGCDPPQWLFDCLVVLSHLNPALNPFLYAYQMSDFRAALKRSFGCGCLAPEERTLSHKLRPSPVSAVNRAAELAD
ncbi:adenosine receptor A2a-like [Ornithodoros turicata]|uniref:adenosine receptor A2a-like n=1 Tax=Ornithodoros turicata TaxID=34597 RepID=UPI003138B266